MQGPGRTLMLLATAMLGGCIPQGVPPERSVRPASQPRLSTDPAVLMVDNGPANWNRKAIAPAAQAVQGSNYVVKAGDTLRGIGNRTGAGSEAIARANGLAAPFIIYPGQKLQIPSGTFHMVEAGQTGIGIARAYGVQWSRIVAENNLEEPYILRVGQRLAIPHAISMPSKKAAAQPPGEQSLEERAKAFDLDIDDVVTGSQPALARGAAPARPAATPAAAVAVSKVKPVAIPKSFGGTFAWPVKGEIVSRFGSTGGGKVNDGIDIGVSDDTPFRASADGVVAYAGDEIKAYGGLILIAHGGGWVTAYGHLSRIDVATGQAIKAGQILGATGVSTLEGQPLLHFEIRRDRKPLDPLTRLPAA